VRHHYTELTCGACSYVYTSPGSSSGGSGSGSSTFQSVRRLTPLWNRTDLDGQKGFAVAVNVTLPPSVRQNGSLQAHVIVVRAGLSPDRDTHQPIARRRTISGDRLQRHHGWSDWMHCSAPLTQWLPPIARNRTMLVGGAQSPGGTPEAHPVVEVEADPLKLCGGLWLLSGLASLLRVDPFIAAARWGALAAALGSTYNAAAATAAQQRQQQQEEEVAAAHRGVLGSAPPPPPQTHWVPKLVLRWSVDDGAYPARLGAPVLYHTIPEGRPVRYALHGGGGRRRAPGGRGEAGRLVPELYVDQLHVVQRRLMPLSRNASLPDPVVWIEWSPTGRVHMQVLRTIEQSLQMYHHHDAVLVLTVDVFGSSLLASATRCHLPVPPPRHPHHHSGLMVAWAGTSRWG
jgi:hypothetical protein